MVKSRHFSEEIYVLDNEFEGKSFGIKLNMYFQPACRADIVFIALLIMSCLSIHVLVLKM